MSESTSEGAIAQMGHSPAPLAKLGEVDARFAAVDRRMDEQKPVDLTATVAEIREFVFRNVMDLRTLLRQDASRSKAALARRIGRLKLTLKETEKGRSTR